MTETKTFQIADYQIDMSRSVIRKGENATQIEPKVLKVLLLLAKRQNQVVTHKEIMDDVWQGTEVVPNALQRCIAIIRKALNDDAKSPTIIVTHKKIGYSLIAEVKWDSEEKDKKELQVTATAENLPGHSLFPLILTALLFVAGVIALLVVAPFGHLSQEHSTQDHFPQEHSPQERLSQQQPSNHSTTTLPAQLSQVKVLTHTDAHESHAIFSPDAQHIVFNRYAGSCKDHLWARNMKNGQETQLTATAAQYSEVSFTNDGRELVFAANKQCPLDQDQEQIDFEKNQPRQTCWHLATLDFSQALTTPQEPNYRHQCQAEKLTTPKALNNHQYVFLQSQPGENQLMHYDDLTKEIRYFYKSGSQAIYHFDYDAHNNRFAIFSRDREYKIVLTLLNHSGQVLHQNNISHHTIKGDIKGNFEPHGNYLLAIIHSQLYKLTLSGELTHIDTPTSDLISVVKHPFKQSLLAVAGTKDIDIASINISSSNPDIDDKTLEQSTNDLNNIKAPYKSLARSSAQEQMARYQPHGNRIAFISDRSGTNQLWLWYKGTAKQLSFETSAKGIQNYSWSPDGTHLAWASDTRIAVANLEGKIKLIPVGTNNNETIDAVIAWYAENELLVLLHDPSPGGLYKLGLQKKQLTALDINYVQAAWVTSAKTKSSNQLEKHIIYKTAKSEVFIRALKNEKKDIGQRLKLNSMALTVAGGFIYSVDKTTRMLNQYNVEGELLKPIRQMKNNAWQITDIKEPDNQTSGSQTSGSQASGSQSSGSQSSNKTAHTLLLSQFIAINQEVVILQ